MVSVFLIEFGGGATHNEILKSLLYEGVLKEKKKLKYTVYITIVGIYATWMVKEMMEISLPYRMKYFTLT